ncbi:hypothetical protein NGM33_28170 [Nocardiopsis dassonvillei]|uniref:hypothetical protein n=1 Tax=Nocardiopsis dassonvillei TaxID=2014 RepID=UPI0013EF40EE|nr:hypothetical protein [Nocardiopsis dassonvillei]MCP3017212.1 hypothetical protein [Nocardiopsis dassonvillei]
MTAASCAREGWKSLTFCRAFKARAASARPAPESGTEPKTVQVPGAVLEHVAAEWDSLVARVTGAAKSTVSRITSTACHGRAGSFHLVVVGSKWRKAKR